MRPIIRCTNCNSTLQLDQAVTTTMMVACPKCEAQLKVAPPPSGSSQNIARDSSAQAVRRQQGDDEREVDPTGANYVEKKLKKKKKSKKRFRNSPSASTWIIAGMGILVVIAGGIFWTGYVGTGPLDFFRWDRTRDYIGALLSKSSVVMLVIKEKQPSLLTNLLKPDAAIDTLRDINPLATRTLAEVEAMPPPYDCREFHKAVCLYLRRIEADINSIIKEITIRLGKEYHEPKSK